MEAMWAYRKEGRSDGNNKHSVCSARRGASRVDENRERERGMPRLTLKIFLLLEPFPLECLSELLLPLLAVNVRQEVGGHTRVLPEFSTFGERFPAQTTSGGWRSFTSVFACRVCGCESGSRDGGGATTAPSAPAPPSTAILFVLATTLGVK